MYISMRRIVVSALILFVGLGARPALAQRLTSRTHAEVRVLAAALRFRADRLAIRGQVASQELTQLQMAPQTFQTQLRIDRLQGRVATSTSELQTVQAVSLLVDQLNTALSAATLFTVRIQLETKMLARLQAKPKSTRRYQAEINNLQIALQADQAALQTLQQQIATLEQQVEQLFD